jgi:pimeloyl-ACP methyl ester carboxylesterase
MYGSGPLVREPVGGIIRTMNVSQVRVNARGIVHNVHVSGPEGGLPVLLVHGNCSSGAYWQPLVRLLPPEWRIVAPDLRGYGDTEPAPVDASRGLRDFADDVAALLDDPALFGSASARPILAGHSMGGGVAMQLLVDLPGRFAGVLLESPVSPYGFGATRDLIGTPTTPDYAGSGGGAVNAEFVKRLAAGDRTSEDPASPRTVMRGTYVADPDAFGADEEAMLDSMLSTVVGEGNYPGDATPSENWPMTAPGGRGVLNTMSPKWFSIAEALIAVSPKPPVAWVRGDADAIVSDASLFDLANLGKLGYVPGWPGDDACPPQPMVSQTRAVLERYAAAGGSFTELVLPGVGHSPHIERPTAFAEALTTLATLR